MSNQVIWVHGNSGQIEVVEPHWGWTTVFGWGLTLEGKVQRPENRDEPWAHFHIPTSSIAIEDSRQLPKLRKVRLLIATDCNAGKRSDWVLEADNYYKYETDNGGAIVTEIDLWDGATFFFKKDDLQWQSTDIETPEEKLLTLPRDVVIQYGLGLSIRVRFKNQMRVGKLRCDDFSHHLSSSASPVPYEPEEEPTTRTKTKSAVFHSIGCEFVPAGP